MKAAKYILALVLAATAAAGFASDPMATRYSMRQCQGSLTPYPDPTQEAVYPDSLVPVFINHVGRHGARYPASAANCIALRKALDRIYTGLHSILQLSLVISVI